MPLQKRAAVEALKERGISDRRSCELISVHRSTHRYQKKRNDDGHIRSRIMALAERHRRYGYRRIQVPLRRDAMAVDHKKVYRIYREENLMLRRRRRKKLIDQRNPVAVAEKPNDI